LCNPVLLWYVQVLAGIGTPGNPKQFYSYLHSQLAALGITGRHPSLTVALLSAQLRVVQMQPCSNTSMTPAKN